jgi:hypothetical protein
LTAERWIELLEESRPEKPSLEIEITNALTPIRINGVVVVESHADLKICSANPSDTSSIVVDRKAGNSAKGLDSCSLTLEAGCAECTFDVPRHKSPARIVAQVAGVQAGSAKVLAIESWDPGIHVQARTASKVAPAKRLAKVQQGKPSIEATVELDGPGRHLLDIFTASWVTLFPTARLVSKDAAGLDVEFPLEVRDVEPGRHTVEVEASRGLCRQLASGGCARLGVHKRIRATGRREPPEETVPGPGGSCSALHGS